MKKIIVQGILYLIPLLSMGQENIQLENKILIDKMDEERQIREHGLGSSPVASAYFKISEIEE